MGGTTYEVSRDREPCSAHGRSGGHYLPRGGIPRSGTLVPRFPTSSHPECGPPSRRTIPGNLLYAAGAHVVVAGHDHNYARFAPQTPEGVANATYGLREFVVDTGGKTLSNEVRSPRLPTARYSTAQHGACWCCVLGEGGYRWRFVPMEGRASPTRAAPHATGSPCSGFASARMWKELESASSRPWDAHDAVPLAPPRTRFPNGTRLTRQTSGPVPVKCTSVVSGVRLSNSVSLTRAVPF
jgi:hypothetical protein